MAKACTGNKSQGEVRTACVSGRVNVKDEEFMKKRLRFIKAVQLADIVGPTPPKTKIWKVRNTQESSNVRTH